MAAPTNTALVKKVLANFSLGPDVSFRGEAEVGRAAEFAASVENDPVSTVWAHFRLRWRH